MTLRTILIAASLPLLLAHPALAQTDPHHPTGGGDAASSEQPASMEASAPMEPRAAPMSDVTCPLMMSMADMMKMMQQSSGDSPDLQMMKMMVMVQTMQITMMQQMQQMQNDKMNKMPALVQKQP